MTNVPTSIASTEVSDIDRSAHCSLSLLIASSLAWLVIGGVLSLISMIQVHTPSFLADCALLSYGRTQALQETALIYGWAVNGGLAVGLWLLARLGGAPLRGGNYISLGGVFWNLGLTAALVGIALGEMTSFSLLQLPRYIQPLMLVAFSAMAAPGVLAWTGRRKEATYATQWYVLGALFLFPWFFSVAQVILLFAPVRGVLQTVVASWYGQNVYSLLLSPLAVAVLYYLLPKVKGVVIPSYEFAIYGFWSLLLFGAWMAGRTLVGGPVPAWIPTMAITASLLVLFHHIILFVNLRGVFSPAGSLSLKFAAFSLAAYLANGLVDAIFSYRVLAAITQFTYFQLAQHHLILAAFTMSIFAAIYYLMPRIAGAAWPSSSLARAHYMASLIGFSVLIATLAIAGWRQGIALNDPKVSFPEIAAATRPWLLVATAAQGLLVVGNLALSIHFVRLLLTKSNAESLAKFNQPSALEASS
jgi:cytochrome c oxidase cbb3-type subunit I